jgi:hypothetical protein
MVNPYKFYTYAYLRKDRTPYYIGKGCGKRIYASKGRPCNKPKDKSRIIFLKQNLTEGEAFKHEIYMISVFGRKDLGTGILYNRTDGGEGHSNPSLETIEKRVKRLKGKKLSESVKKKISDTAKGRSNYWLKGIPRSEETKQKISEATKGILRTEKTKQNISKALKGKPKSENTKEKFKKIMEEKYSHICYEIITPDRNIEYVKNSLKKYSKENGLNSGSMYNVANGKANHHKGYKVKKYINNEVL